MFQGCKQEDMPPHIYAVAQTAYRSMMATNKSQSIVLRGNTGSGKTYNFKQLVNYYSALKTPNVTGVGKLNLKRRCLSKVKNKGTANTFVAVISLSLLLTLNNSLSTRISKTLHVQSSF